VKTAGEEQFEEQKAEMICQGKAAAG